MTRKPANSTPAPRCSFTFADGRRCALPSIPNSGGLCYPHFHAPHRRLRPSDLTRELTTPFGGPIPEEKIQRVVEKLPLAVADGTLTPSQARSLRYLCALMLQCTRFAAEEFPTDPRDPSWTFLANLLSEDSDDDQPSPPQLHR
jgi:hypothetical protein